MNELNKLSSLLREFAILEKDLINSQGLPLQVARLLVAICEIGETDISTSDANKMLNYNSATLSRNINTLSSRPKRTGKGLGLITTKENPQDRREKIISLTIKGKNFRDRLKTILDK
jgi:DNA-binding MarR family transcriptional regulator